MNNVEIKLTGYSNHNLVFINGALQKEKKNKFGSNVINYSTDEEKINLQVLTFSEYTGKCWFILKLLYFIISLFGILDIPSNKRHITTNLNVDLLLTENCSYTLRFLAPKKDTECAKIESESKFETITNTYLENEKIKKRIKIFKIFKILSWLSLVAILVVLLII